MTHPQPSPQIKTPPGPHEPTDTARLAAALGRIPSGLFVITWRHAGHDRGMLASWVMQAGFEPPLLALAAARSRDLLAAIDHDTPFVVNVLAESQRALVGRFGKPVAPGEDPFAGLPIERTATDTVTLTDAAAWLECLPTARTGGDAAATGDHTIVVARVIGAGGSAERSPLVHLRRNGLRY